MSLHKFTYVLHIAIRLTINCSLWEWETKRVAVARTSITLKTNYNNIKSYNTKQQGSWEQRHCWSFLSVITNIIQIVILLLLLTLRHHIICCKTEALPCVVIFWKSHAVCNTFSIGAIRWTQKNRSFLWIWFGESNTYSQILGASIVSRVIYTQRMSGTFLPLGEMYISHRGIE